MRFLLFAILGFCLLVPPVGGQSVCGVIVTTGATIEVGSSTVPGTVTIDPCLVGGSPPDIPSPGTIGTVPAMTGTLPAFPGGGTGADGAYHATADATLAAGTWNFSEFTVDNAVTVTCTGAVTINVQSGAAVNGKLHSTADGASILIRCGGSFTMKGEPAGVAAIETTGANAHVDVITNGIASLLDRNHVSSTGGDVRLVVLGTAGTGPAVIMNPADLDTDAGDLTIISRYGMDLQAATITTETGTLLVQSFEWTITIGRSSFFACDDGPEAAIEGYGGVTVTGSSYVSNQTSPIRIVSPDGTVRLDDHCTVESNGNLAVHAQDEVVFIKSPMFESDGGDLKIYCHAGDVGIEVEGPGPWGSASIQADGGEIDIRASGSVAIGGGTRIRSDKGRIDIRAVGGNVDLEQNAKLGETYDRDCEVDVRAAGGIDARIPAMSSGGGHMRGASVLLSAGADGISLAQDRMVSVEAGGIQMFSAGTITIDNDLHAYRDILVSSRSDVIAIGCEVSTEATEGTSGAITLESWGSTRGRVDATDAHIHSGGGDGSGDVSLLVRTPGGVEPPPPAIESFFLPKRIKVKVNTKKLEKSFLAAVGFFDTGPDPVDLTKGSTLTIGNAKFVISGLVPSSNGSKYVHKTDQLTFSIKPNRRGSSRAKFTLKMRGDLTGQVDPDQPLALRFECGGMDGKGTCALTAGRYALKKVRGTLIDPDLYLWKVKAKAKGAGKDALKLIFGLATEGPTPPQALDVRVMFGDAFDVTVPAGSFKREGDVYLFRGDISGITLVKLDFLREAVTISGKKMDLGSFKDGLIPVLVGVEIGGGGGANRVRMSHSGTQLRY